jgi:hypothetical protein
MSKSAIILEVTTPVSPVPTRVPFVVGKIKVPDAFALALKVVVPVVPENVTPTLPNKGLVKVLFVIV